MRLLLGLSYFYPSYFLIQHNMGGVFGLLAIFARVVARNLTLLLLLLLIEES